MNIPRNSTGSHSSRCHGQVRSRRKLQMKSGAAAVLFVLLVLSCLSQTARATLTLLDNGKRYACQQDEHMGKTLWKGYEYMARLQYVPDNIYLCPNPHTNNNKIINITVPPDGLPVALLAREGGGCSYQDKANFITTHIRPVGVVKYIITDGANVRRLQQQQQEEPNQQLQQHQRALLVQRGDFSLDSLEDEIVIGLAEQQQEELVERLWQQVQDIDTAKRNSTSTSTASTRQSDTAKTTTSSMDHASPRLEAVRKSESYQDYFFHTTDTNTTTFAESPTPHVSRVLSKVMGWMSDDTQNSQQNVLALTPTSLTRHHHSSSSSSSKKDTEKDFPYYLIHVSFTTEIDLLNYILNTQPGQDSVPQGGPRISIDSRKGTGSAFFSGPAAVWIAVSALISACACSCLIIHGGTSTWPEDAAHNATIQHVNPHRRPPQRRLTREQIQTFLPVYRYDGTTLHIIHRPPNDTGGGMMDPTTGGLDEPLLSSSNDPNDVQPSHRRRHRRHHHHHNHPATVPGPDPAVAEMCSICLDEYEPGDRMRVLPCAHLFHSKCIGKWLAERAAVCPLCKTELFLEEEEEESESSEDTGEQVDATSLLQQQQLRNRTNDVNVIGTTNGWWASFFPTLPTSTNTATATTAAAVETTLETPLLTPIDPQQQQQTLQQQQQPSSPTARLEIRQDDSHDDGDQNNNTTTGSAAGSLMASLFRRVFFSSQSQQQSRHSRRSNNNNNNDTTVVETSTPASMLSEPLLSTTATAAAPATTNEQQQVVNDMMPILEHDGMLLSTIDLENPQPMSSMASLLQSQLLQQQQQQQQQQQHVVPESTFSQVI